MRNFKWKRKLITLAVAAACIAAFYFLYLRGSDSVPDDVTPQAELAAAFPEKPEAQQLSSEYRQVAENGRLILRMREDTLGIQVEETGSGYVWTSEAGTADEDMNTTWLNFMQSGLSIEYFEKEKSITTRTDLLSETNKTVEVKPLGDGFHASIRFHDLKIGLDVVVKLQDGELTVEVPQDSILEGDRFKLASVFAYPFLGATKGGAVGGYMFIPDGSGALVKLADNRGKFKTPYEAKIYGANRGIDSVTTDRFTNQPYQAQFPVFGIVHGEKQHAVFGIVERGQHNAKILSYPNGVNTPYNWTTVQFLIRESYLQPTSRSMGGIIVFEKTRNPEDLRVRYSFLNDDEATYVGMAKTYRKYLIGQGALQEQPKTGGNAQIPLHLDILGAESESGMLSNRLIPMTTVAQLQDILDGLKAEGINRTYVVYKGWNEGGFSGTNPAPVNFESALGSAGDFGKLQERLEKQGGRLYYYSDYTTAYESSKRFTARVEAAERFDKTVLSLPTFQDVYDTKYWMSARKTKQVVESNLESYKKKEIHSVAVDVTPSELFSESVEGAPSSRKNTADTYRQQMENLAKEMSQVAMYRPNDYMLGYADQLLDIRMDSSDYVYISETVPFEQIVLKGYKDYFAGPVNFTAKPQQTLLKMIETGSYPSFFLTHESSFLLKNTNSSDVFASAYTDWKEDIVQTYKAVNEALGQVQDATIEDRFSPAKGVVQVTYSNGKAIVVNYNEQDYEGAEGSVPALGYRVFEVKR